MKIKYRVKSHEDFQKVIHENKKISNKCFVVYYMCNNLGYARVGISASKKLGNAVVRSKVRRQVRVMAREVINFNNKFDYCIIVKNCFIENAYKTNLEELKKLFAKIQEE